MQPRDESILDRFQHFLLFLLLNFESQRVRNLLFDLVYIGQILVAIRVVFLLATDFFELCQMVEHVLAELSKLLFKDESLFVISGSVKCIAYTLNVSLIPLKGESILISLDRSSEQSLLPSPPFKSSINKDRIWHPSWSIVDTLIIPLASVSSDPSVGYCHPSLNAGSYIVGDGLLFVIDVLDVLVILAPC